MSKADTHVQETQPSANGTANGKPARVLPTNRVAFSKQLEILRAFGALGSTGRATSNVEVAKVINLHSGTISLVTPFLADVGLLRKTADGFSPCEEVVKFNQAHQWSPETAAHRLSPLVSRAWFSEPVISRLRFGPISEDSAIKELALLAHAGPSYRSQLGFLIDYLDASGLVSREDDQVRLPQRSPAIEADGDDEGRVTAVTQQQLPRQSSPVATTFVNDAAGVVQFNISVKVDMTEFANWEPTRISAFFAGIAQVLAAKAAVEKHSTGS